MVWGSNYETNLKPVTIAQKRAIRLISGASRISHSSPLFRDMKLLKLIDLVNYQLLLVMHDCLFGRLPVVISRNFALRGQDRPSRIAKHFSELIITSQGDVVPNYRLHNYRLFSPFCKAPKVWNRIIATRIPNLHDIPPSKCFFKCIIRL